MDSKQTRKTKKELKKQKCPRKLVCDGPSKSIYKRYGWRKSENNDSLEYEKRMESVKKLASDDSLKVLDKLCAKYERTYGLWF